jgi:hypothetical protein
MRQRQTVLSIMTVLSLAACGSDKSGGGLLSTGGASGVSTGGTAASNLGGAGGSSGGSSGGVSNVSAGGTPGAGGTPATGGVGAAGGTLAAGGTVGAGGGIAAAGGTGTGAGGAPSVDPFNGMCSSARWSTVSPDCWSCWCSKCASSLNAATRRSLEIFECMREKKLLVNDNSQLQCEVRAGTKECVGSDTADWNKLVTFDECLFGALTPKATGEFRACDTTCGTTYSGDVCTRYPQ